MVGVLELSTQRGGAGKIFRISTEPWSEDVAG